MKPRESSRVRSGGYVSLGVAVVSAHSIEPVRRGGRLSMQPSRGGERDLVDEFRLEVPGAAGSPVSSERGQRTHQ